MTGETRRIRDLYHEYLQGRVTFEHLVETANQRLARWEAGRAATEADATESAVDPTDP